MDTRNYLESLLGAYVNQDKGGMQALDYARIFEVDDPPEPGAKSKVTSPIATRHRPDELYEDVEANLARVQRAVRYSSVEAFEYLVLEALGHIEDFDHAQRLGLIVHKDMPRCIREAAIKVVDSRADVSSFKIEIEELRTQLSPIGAEAWIDE